MGLMDLFNQGDIREKIYAAANRNPVPQGGVTGAAFNALFPHGLGNLAFGREPQATPDLASPEGTQYMADLAQNMVMPGTFIGPKGMSNLLGDDVARGLMSGAEAKLAQGVPREEVFRELGVFKGPEGKWRYEIDDSGMTGIRGGMGDGVKDSGGAYLAKVGDAINHDELFKSSPSLRYINLEMNPSHPTSGSHIDGHIAVKGDVATQREWVANAQQLAEEFAQKDFKDGDFGSLREALAYHNAEFAKDAKYGDLSNSDASTLLHELQHAVQGREGFARGGNPSLFQREMVEANEGIGRQNNILRYLSKEMDAAREAGDSAKLAELKARYEREMNYKLEKLVPKAIQDPFESYQRLAGEAEAREVQKRMNMGMGERRALFPEYAGRNDLIVRGLMSGR